MGIPQELEAARSLSRQRVLFCALGGLVSRDGRDLAATTSIGELCGIWKRGAAAK